MTWDVERLRRIARTRWEHLTDDDDAYMQSFALATDEDEFERVVG